MLGELLELDDDEGGIGMLAELVLELEAQAARAAPMLTSNTNLKKFMDSVLLKQGLKMVYCGTAASTSLAKQLIMYFFRTIHFHQNWPVFNLSGFQSFKLWLTIDN